jgi:hypothetical protein
MYNKNSIWNFIDNEVHLNFEGFNKYFLNLEVGDLESIHEKEIINDFYYNITNELINSYKTLYNWVMGSHESKPTLLANIQNQLK